MTPAQITAWIQVAQLLIPIGENIGGKIASLIHAAHPTLTVDQIAAAYAAIIADYGVRSAIAAREAGQTTV